LYRYFGFDIIADSRDRYVLACILPAAISGFGIALRIGHGDQKFMLHPRARISHLQKLPFVRNAGRIDLVVANVKAIEIGDDARDHLIALRFDSDRNVISCDGSSVLNRKFHNHLTLLIGEIYQHQGNEVSFATRPLLNGPMPGVSIPGKGG
jgi:hypothetical protein